MFTLIARNFPNKAHEIFGNIKRMSSIFVMLLVCSTKIFLHVLVELGKIEILSIFAMIKIQISEYRYKMIFSCKSSRI